MALMNCPEYDLQVSDKALFCPHCGFPLKGTKEQKRRYIPRRLRLPNGFGSITEIKGRHLRNRLGCGCALEKLSKVNLY